MTTQSKFIGRITLESHAFTIQRTDIGGTLATVNLTDGNYFPIGRVPAQVDGAQTDSTLTVETGHDLETGDTVTVWDVSANTSIGTRLVVSSTATTVTLSSSIAVGDEDQIYVSDDLFSHVQTLVRADVPAELMGFTISVTSLGIVSLKLASGQTATLTWTSAGTDIRDWWRLGSSTTNTITDAASANTGTYSHAYGFYPEKAIVEDLPLQEETTSQTIADDGTVETHWWATKYKRRAEIQFNGGPEASTWVEMYSYEDFWNNVLKIGREFRWYRDKTEKQIWQRKTNPDGYRVWVKESPVDYSPAPLQSGWYGYFTQPFTFQEYERPVAPTAPAEEVEIVSYTSYSTMKAALTSEGDIGKLVTDNGTVGYWIHDGTYVLPIGWVDYTQCETLRWGRVASVTSTTILVMEAGHTVQEGDTLRVYDVSGSAELVDATVTTVATNTVTIDTAATGVAAGDRCYVVETMLPFTVGDETRNIEVMGGGTFSITNTTGITVYTDTDTIAAFLRIFDAVDASNAGATYTAASEWGTNVSVANANGEYLGSGAFQSTSRTPYHVHLSGMEYDTGTPAYHCGMIYDDWNSSSTAVASTDVSDGSAVSGSYATCFGQGTAGLRFQCGHAVGHDTGAATTSARGTWTSRAVDLEEVNGFCISVESTDELTHVVEKQMFYYQEDRG